MRLLWWLVGIRQRAEGEEGKGGRKGWKGIKRYLLKVSLRCMIELFYIYRREKKEI